MKRTDHVIFNFQTGLMQCGRCGATRVLFLPAPLKDAMMQMKAFTAGHRFCKL